MGWWNNMSANDNKIYYWLKLKKDFFDSHRIKIIEDMPNGKDYVLFYLKLMCEATSHQGRLRFSENIPYSESMLASLTNTKIDSVHSALEIFGQLDMIVLREDGTYFLPEVEKLIGKETGQAIRKREALEKAKENEENAINTDVGGKIYPTDTTDEGKTYPRDKNIEYRDKSIDNRKHNVLGKPNPLCNDIQDKQDIRLQGKQNPLLSRLIVTDYTNYMNARYLNEYNDFLNLLCQTYGTSNVAMSLDYFIQQTITYDVDRKTGKVVYGALRHDIKHRLGYFEEAMFDNCDKFKTGYFNFGDVWAKSLGFKSCEDMHNYFQTHESIPAEKIKDMIQ
jgi:predicted phage replisome organizer